MAEEIEETTQSVPATSGPSNPLYLERTGVRQYVARNARGAEVLVGDGPGRFSPGDLLKLALAGCNAMSSDVHVLLRFWATILLRLPEFQPSTTRPKTVSPRWRSSSFKIFQLSVRKRPLHFFDVPRPRLSVAARSLTQFLTRFRTLCTSLRSRFANSESRSAFRRCLPLGL